MSSDATGPVHDAPHGKVVLIVGRSAAWWVRCERILSRVGWLAMFAGGAAGLLSFQLDVDWLLIPFFVGLPLGGGLAQAAVFAPRSDFRMREEYARGYTTIQDSHRVDLDLVDPTDGTIIRPRKPSAAG